MSILPFMLACSYSAPPPDKKIDTKQATYVAYQGSSYDLNEVKKIELLVKDRAVHYANKFNAPREKIDDYKYWYLVTGTTQSNGGWHYQTSIKSRNISLCLTAPNPLSAQVMALQVPLLLVGANSDIKLIFDKTCG